jgi:hypothetical protein
MALTDNLISFWEMEEASGTRVDSHGSNDLTDHNTVTQSTGIVGNSAHFAAASTEYLDVASNAELVTGDVDYFWQVWVYLDNKSAFRWFVGKYGAVANREYYLIYSSSSDRFEFNVLSNVSNVVTANNFGSPSTATWYCIHAWHDSGASTVNIAVNDGTANSVSIPLAASTSTFQVEFGASPTILGTVHDGRLDQCGFWKSGFPTDAGTFAGARTALYNGGAGLSYAAMSGGSFDPGSNAGWYPNAPSRIQRRGGMTPSGTTGVTRIQSEAAYYEGLRRGTLTREQILRRAA